MDFPLLSGALSLEAVDMHAWDGVFKFKVIENVVPVSDPRRPSIEVHVQEVLGLVVGSRLKAISFVDEPKAHFPFESWVYRSSGASESCVLSKKSNAMDPDIRVPVRAWRDLNPRGSVKKRLRCLLML